MSKFGGFKRHLKSLGVYSAAGTTAVGTWYGAFQSGVDPRTAAYLGAGAGGYMAGLLNPVPTSTRQEVELLALGSASGAAAVGAELADLPQGVVMAGTAMPAYATGQFSKLTVKALAAKLRRPPSPPR